MSPRRVKAETPCADHPPAELDVDDVDRGGCPEEGVPFESERCVVCRTCGHEVATGTTACLRFLLLLVAGKR